MDARERGDLTALPSEVRAGRPDAQDRLMRASYSELRRTAGGLLRHERAGHTLQPGALVHEALLRLLSGEALTESDCRFARAWLRGQLGGLDQ